MSLLKIWTTNVQNCIPIYQQIWILQIFSHFSRFLAYNFYTPVFRRDVLWYGDVRPGLRPGLRPSDSPSVRSPSAHFPHFSPTCFDIFSWNFAHDFVLMYYRSSWTVVTLRQFLKELCLFVNLDKGNVQFSALFSYMLWHIELKFCIWLCFTVLQIKFECR